MDMEEDDSMEIEETMPAAPIIERRSDEFTPTNISFSEKDNSTQNIETIPDATKSNVHREKSYTKPPDKTSFTTTKQPTKNKTNKTGDKQVDVVILDDDDDEPMKTVEGNFC